MRNEYKGYTLEIARCELEKDKCIGHIIKDNLAITIVKKYDVLKMWFFGMKFIYLKAQTYEALISEMRNIVDGLEIMNSGRSMATKRFTVLEDKIRKNYKNEDRMIDQILSSWIDRLETNIDGLVKCERNITSND